MKVLKNLLCVAILVGIAVFIVPCFSRIYAEELRFDEEGNLIFSTYDKKATTKVCYKTIGWTMKKYDDPIDAGWQVSGILPVSGFYYEIDDPANPGYMYVYFIMDKEDVLATMEEASVTWKETMEKYGGTIYLDNIMTVVESDVDKGGLDENKNPYGEVYFECEGIRNARFWADPSCFDAYFGIPVGFPKTYEFSTDISILETVTSYISGYVPSNSGGLCSHSRDEQEYDVEEGIPSGEDLCFEGQAKSYLIEAEYAKHTGVASVPVTVIKEYELLWTDMEGKPHRETETREYICNVPKEYEYYTVDSVDIYCLDRVVISGSATGTVEKEISVESGDIEVSSYSDEGEYIQANSTVCYAKKETIDSSLRYRPDIPNEDLSGIAMESDIELIVKSDGIVVNGEKMSIEEFCSSDCEEIMGDDEESIYIEDIIIDKECKNGSVSDEKAEYIYVSGDKEKIVNVELNTILVHTPVISKTSIQTAKAYNMSVEPNEKQIVIGTEFSIKSRVYGEHLNIKGYGKRYYDEYKKTAYVKLGFDVLVDDELYSAGSLIEIESESLKCKVPEYVKIGDYNVYVYVIAHNAGESFEWYMENGGIGKGANLELSQYVAVSELEVELIGTLYGFNVDDDGNSYYVGKNMGFFGKVKDSAGNLPMYVSKKEAINLVIYSNGFGAEEGSLIKGDISFFALVGGERIEVSLYTDNGHTLLDEADYTEVTDEVLWITKEEIRDNVYKWQTTLNMSENLVIMPKEIYPGSQETVKKYAVKAENVILNSDISGYVAEKCENSYINVENFKDGYCNMWKSEGYTYEFVDKNGEKTVLCDGDFAVLELPQVIYQDYDVVGTH